MVESKMSLGQFYDELADDDKHSGCGSCGSGKSGEDSRCGNGLEKIYPTTAVRFGYMKSIGEFTYPEDMKFTCGAKVIMQTKRGLEIGDQVSLVCNGCDKSVTRDQIKSYVNASGEDSYLFEAGRILREATSADLAEYARIQSDNRPKQTFCQKVAGEQKLPLSIVECESIFGGERIIFYFTAAERIDFRNMVKELAREYRTRIEMRQIGARDEARLLADYETCGREVCCKVFLKTLRPISMRMAKVQKATLDPSQVSGRCGRLKCCLRYEHVAYEELDKQLPKIGMRIRTNHGIGKVINRQILTQIVQIRKDDDTIVAVVAEDVTELNVPASVKDEVVVAPAPVKEKSSPKSDSSSAPNRQSKKSSSQRRNRRNRSDGNKSSPGKTPQAKPQGENKGNSPQASTPGNSSAGDSQAKKDDSQQSDRPRKKRRRRGRKRGGGEGGSGSNNPSSPSGG